MSDIDIVQLVERLQNGEKSSADEIYRQYSELLTKFVIKQGLSEFDAQDVVSDTFVEMMKHIDQLKDPSAFSSWIHTIAKHKAWEAKNKLSRCQDLTTGTDETDDFTDQEQAIELEYARTREDTIMLPQDYAENEEVKQIIAEQIDALSKDHKEALLLFYYKDKSIAEIAELTGTNENNVKQRLYAARKKLKANLEKLQKSGVVLYAVPLAKLISFFAKDSDIFMDTGSAESDASSAGEYNETTLNADERPHQVNGTRRRRILYAVSGICAAVALCFGICSFIRSSKEPDPHLPDDSQATTEAPTIENETTAISTTIATDTVNSTLTSTETTTTTSAAATSSDTAATTDIETTSVQEQPTEPPVDPTDNTPDTVVTPPVEEPAVQEQPTEQPVAATSRAVAVATQAVTTTAAPVKNIVKPTICGDVNGDTLVDIEDFIIVNDYVVKYNNMTWAEYCKEIKLALNADQALANADTFRASDKREITKEDGTAIMGHITGEYPNLPIDELDD